MRRLCVRSSRLSGSGRSTHGWHWGTHLGHLIHMGGHIWGTSSTRGDTSGANPSPWPSWGAHRDSGSMGYGPMGVDAVGCGHHGAQTPWDEDTMGYGHHGIWTPHDTGAIGHRPMGHGHHMDPWDTDTVGHGARGRRHHGTRTAHGHVGYGQHMDTTGHGAIAHGWTPMGPTQHMMTHGDMDTNGTPRDTMGHHGTWTQGTQMDTMECTQLEHNGTRGHHGAGDTNRTPWDMGHQWDTD